MWDDVPVSLFISLTPLYLPNVSFQADRSEWPSSILLTRDTGSQLNLPPVFLTSQSYGPDCLAVCVDDPHGKTQAVTLSKGPMSDVYVPDMRMMIMMWLSFTGSKSPGVGLV